MMHLKYVNLLIKPVSSMCNLRCKYCFYEDEANNRMQHSMGVMREEERSSKEVSWECLAR